jgi:hypothetical protein
VIGVGRVSHAEQKAEAGNGEELRHWSSGSRF